MTLEEFYNLAGGDYRSAITRLISEKTAKKFIFKLPADDSFTNLKNCLAAGNLDEAFRHVHTLKGVAYNLGLTALGDSASALCEDLRGGGTNEAQALFEQLEERYLHTIDLIANLSVDNL